MQRDQFNSTEISSRIVQAKKKKRFQRMKSELTNKHIISIHIRRMTLECYVELILMYGCESYKELQKKLEATEMRFLRRMLRIS